MFAKISMMFAAGLLIFGAGCKSDRLTGDSGNDGSNPDKITIVENIDKIDIKKDRLVIEAAGVKNDVLTLTVSYGGGCREHNFALFGNNTFMESEPVQSRIQLSHDGHNDPCDAWISAEIKYNLKPLRAVYEEQYGEHGRIILRIYAPGAEEPFEPSPLYEF
jgi:hypothetical protein